MNRSFEGLLEEFRRDVQGSLPNVRAKVEGERLIHELRLKADGIEYCLSPVLWGHLAHIGTLDKLALMFVRKGEYGTFEILAIARNLFENLVWLRFLNQDFRNGLVFYARFLAEEIQSYESYIHKIAGEASLFESADQLDSDGLMSTIGAVLDHDPKSPSVVEAQQEHLRQTATLDDMVRREFSLYAAAAAHNGYAYQAYLLRNDVIPDFEGKLAKAKDQRIKLLTYIRMTLPRVFLDAAEQKWNWQNRAEKVGLLQHYEFLYRFTSRLLHSTPTNIITEKVLNDSEAAIIMDYVVVASRDILTAIRGFDYPGRMKAVAINVGAAEEL